MRRLHPLVTATALGLWALGCAVPCPPAVLSATDGGALACADATDCPRLAGARLCVDGLDPVRGCTGCEASRCVTYPPAGACP